jgi:catechol 2,3-dioxygenase-like lactoylglutathione lyase family enzyme
MPRVQLALRVADLEGSIAFYSKLFGAEPAKRRPGYANFAIAEPPLKLVLIEGAPGESTRMDHLGVEFLVASKQIASSPCPRRRAVESVITGSVTLWLPVWLPARTANRPTAPLTWSW